jgi:hypothetical protein
VDTAGDGAPRQTEAAGSRMTVPAARPQHAAADIATWQALRFYLRLGDSVLEQHQPNHPARQSFPDLLDMLNTQIARTRNGTAEIGTVLAELDLIGCVEAGQILNRSARRAAQIADELGGVKVGGRGGYVFHRPTVTAYAERQRKRE